MTRMEILQGTLDVLVLKTLVGGPSHGYQIARSIKARSEEVLQVEEGALYPALHRLERRGWVAAEWGRSENGRRAKFYSLTAEGQGALRTETVAWDRYTAAVGRVLEDAPRGAE
ncbi:MAG TPA: PadR family transcriptional regulator [Longimicrobiales bacterium]|nr:PadR family transcriptional regulator [Longimicrobiales bacterium]